MIESDFAESIAEDYGSDAPRLIFADWLLERGEDRRAELIHLQCALARVEGQPRTPEINRMYSRQTQLEPIIAAWLKAAQFGLPPYGVGLHFARGLIEQVYAPAELWAANARVIVERVPLFMSLRLRGGLPIVPELARVRSLTCEETVSTADLARALAIAPLYALRLHNDRVDDDTAALLADHPAASSLRELSLPTISQFGLSAVAGSSRLAGLQRLVLYRFGGPRGANALITATWADTIRELVIHKKAVDTKAMDMLHARFGARFRTYPIAT